MERGGRALGRIDVGVCVKRLSLGKLLVNLLQVVKRTINNTPLKSLTNGVVDRLHHNKLFQIFPWRT